MSVQLNPYLSFSGTAREALTAYRSAFGGELTMTTFAESGMAGDGVDPDHVMHGQLTTDDGFVLMASDVPPGTEHQPGSGSPISLSGDDEARLRAWWDALRAGGSVELELAQAPWGDTFGMCTDRFGTRWMVNVLAAPAD